MSDAEFKLEHQLAVCQQVGKLVRAKLPIAGELATATKHSSNSVSTLAENVDQRISQGESLASALTIDDGRDSKVLAACIEAGEQSGQLDTTLESWTGMHIANAGSARSLRAALVYPALLIVLTIVALGFVIWTIVPEYRQTYALFDRELPSWLIGIVWIREKFGLLIIVLLSLSILPLLIWYWRQRGFGRDGQPRSAATQLRSQALSAKVAACMLDGSLPLNRISQLTTQAAGGSTSEIESSFERVQKQQVIPPLAREVSMLLASLHSGIIDRNEASEHLHRIAEHLNGTADITAARQARWIPMLVALTVGLLTIATYVFLIYLPWIWLMQKIVTPDVESGL